MTLLAQPLPALLATAGVTLFATGTTRRPDPGLKPSGLAALCSALALALTPGPAHADQFVEAADGAAIDCVLARGALTRIALVEDGFANVSKMASGYPYNDFEVTHEPVRGDIYVSVPLQYASAKVSFFATSTGGYVYKFVCRVGGEEASQLFVTNPALARLEAGEWEQAAPRGEDAAVRLIEAMASDAVLPDRLDVGSGDLYANGIGIIAEVGEKRFDPNANCPEQQSKALNVVSLAGRQHRAEGKTCGVEFGGGAFASTSCVNANLIRARRWGLVIAHSAW